MSTQPTPGAISAADFEGHTPGPWSIDETFSNRQEEVKADRAPWIQNAIVKKDGEDVTLIIAIQAPRHRGEETKAMRANIRLMASAPLLLKQLIDREAVKPATAELLEACKILQKRLELGAETHGESVRSLVTDSEIYRWFSSVIAKHEART